MDSATATPKKESSIVSLIFTVEALLFMLGIIWMLIRKIPVFDGIKINTGSIIAGVILSLAIIASNAIFYVIDKKYFNSRIRRMMEENIYPLFRNISLVGIFIVALMSGFSEEFFFRGILMAEFGVVISSIIFGLLHTSGKDTWMMGAWTTIIGIVFALVYKATGNLFIPALAHTLNNLFSIIFIRYVYYKMLNGRIPGLDKDEEKTTDNEPYLNDVMEDIPEAPVSPSDLRFLDESINNKKE